MSDVTVSWLDRWSRGGDAGAFGSLMPLVYDELHQLAAHYMRHERPGHTLQPTALVHEAYLRLSGLRDMRLQNRTHFYGAAAQVMRGARLPRASKERRQARKRGPTGGARSRVRRIDRSAAGSGRARSGARKLRDLRRGQSAGCRIAFFGGLSVEETAEIDLSPRTVKRHWRFSRAWLLRTLGGS